MWRRGKIVISKGCNFRQFSSSSSSATQTRILEDEGDWSYASEWWGGSNSDDGHTVLRSSSDKGNGVVSVVAYPSSRPDAAQWRVMEQWLQQRYQLVHPEEHHVNLEVLGFQWRVLRFNDFTRQSTVKIVAASKKSNPEDVYIMQQPHILPVPYLKSMVSNGLATLASCSYDLISAVHGKKPMRVLCVGHGGGNLPLYLASKIQGAMVDSVEIDSLVISASIKGMGFPAFAMMKSSGERILSRPVPMDEVLWKGTHERLFLHESDAEEFILNTTNIYDLVFIDAYDGHDVFPRKLWDPDSPFLDALRCRLHPNHGTVVVNLHADTDVLDANATSFQHLLPLAMGKYVSKVCRAYKDVLAGGGNDCRRGGIGLGFIVSVPWLCNASLVVCRGYEANGMTPNRDSVLNTLMSKSLQVEDALNLPFSCLEYIKRGFILV